MAADEVGIEIRVNIDQARAIASALDVFTRLSMGQIGILVEMISMQRIPMYAENGRPSLSASHDVCDEVRERVRGSDIVLVLAIGICRLRAVVLMKYRKRLKRYWLNCAPWIPSFEA